MNVQISITGAPRSGKSTIAYLVSRYLKQKGFDVELSLLDGSVDQIETGIVQRTCALQAKDTKIVVAESILPIQ